MTMTMDAKWLGPCAADQKPGDMIMSNGMKINIPETEKRSIAPAPTIRSLICTSPFCFSSVPWMTTQGLRRRSAYFICGPNLPEPR